MSITKNFWEHGFQLGFDVFRQHLCLSRFLDRGRRNIIVDGKILKNSFDFGISGRQIYLRLINKNIARIWKRDL